MTTALLTKEWPIRALIWYDRHPLVGYLVLFASATLWALTPRRGDALALVLVALPWVTLCLLMLHLPLLGGAIRKLTLPLPVRRNHALEHGTIQFLRRAYGVSKGVGGMAASNGFRVSGARQQADIERAFADFLALPPSQRRALAVADQCGSMAVVTQGLGVALIAATLLAVAVWRFTALETGVILALQFLLFILGRRPIGRALQARRLLALDFQSAYIQRIEKVRPVHVIERSPVYFVRTVIEGAAEPPRSSGRKPQKRGSRRSP